MHSSNLLYVPLRNTQALDLGKELSNAIALKFFQPASLFEQDLNYLTSLRDKVTGISNDDSSLSASIVQLESFQLTLFTYLSCLKELDKKFFDGCVDFTWFPTIYSKRSTPVTSDSFQYEELNIIFQIGCIYSLMGFGQSRHLDEGLKKSCQYFQLAAGSFTKVQQQVDRIVQTPVENRQFDPPLDFQKETIQCLSNLMLAQAQETVWQKAINNDTTKDSIVARLSFQTFVFYSEAFRLGQLSSFIRLEWINHIAIKKFHFLAAAHLRSSIASLNSFQYGEQVAHLRIAQQAIDKAGKYKRYVNQFVLEDFSGLSETIAIKLRVAEKDNDLIYLRIVPKESDLKPIVGVSMVKPIESDKFGDLLPSARNPLFADLIPYVIINYAQAMRERQEDFVQSKIYDPLQSLNLLMTKFLVERDIESNIDSLEQPENIPDSIINHSREIMDHGGISSIEWSFSELSKLNKECSHLVVECQKRIDIYRQEDEMIKRMHGPSGDIRPNTSSDASDILIAKVDKMREYLKQAELGDKTIIEKYNGIAPVLKVFVGGYSSLNKFIPNSNYAKLDENLSLVISELRDCVSKWETIKSDRSQFIIRVEKKNRENTILPKLIEEYKQNKESLYDSEGQIKSTNLELIYEAHLKILDQDLAYLQQTKQDQQQLEHQIEALNSKFLAHYHTSVSSTQLQRQQALQSLDAAYVKYLEIISNLEEGVKFYHDFINKGTRLLHELEEYLGKRRMESRELEMALSNHQQRIKEQQQKTALSSQAAVRQEIVSPKGQKTNIWNPDSGIKFD
ncbi:RIM20 [Candida oxycetoniae]|uniref:RIM20 n=1 Tax=Candida oxycetoniae TaxID=497107 RepID=A0AAI9T1X0_9ASCO|nr:RIM20 [Candida oxycetoniae]KAI3406811.2 RIM20 [Candida oxycetoniae]